MELNAVVLASLCLVGFTQGAAIDETAMLGKRHGPGEESSLTFNLLSKLFETVEEEIDETKNDLEETKTDLEETKTDLEETKTDLEETRTNLYNSKSEVYPTFQAKLCLSYFLFVCLYPIFTR